MRSSRAPFSAGLICQWSGYCRTLADCVLDNKCNIQSTYYSHCIPDTSAYRTANCIANYATKCTDSTECCDPAGAYCNAKSFRQCQQPPQNSSMCLTLSSFPTNSPSKLPIGAPSLIPLVSPSTAPSDLTTASPNKNHQDLYFDFKSSQ